jgi:hypothetical protein
MQKQGRFKLVVTNDTPCFKCKDRQVKCHSICERYSEWVNKAKKRNTVKNTINEQICSYIAYMQKKKGSKK